MMKTSLKYYISGGILFVFGVAMAYLAAYVNQEKFEDCWWVSTTWVFSVMGTIVGTVGGFSSVVFYLIEIKPE